MVDWGMNTPTLSVTTERIDDFVLLLHM